jgi:glycerophosphoryl diester phosphodiesterase
VKFDSRFAGERIPTLAEVFEVTAGRCGLNIELKAAGTEKPVCETVRSHGAIGTTLVSSFEREQLGRIRLLAPEIRVGLLASRRARQLVAAAVEMGAYAINPRYDLVNAELCRAAHERSLQVYAWTADEPELMRKLIDKGVDGIMTNYPERLRQVGGR